ncbi:MAG: AIM24 family protein, partial [Pyrinomonadaceae bacterium]
MNCRSCGAGLVPGAKFCGACGTTVAAAEAPPSQYQAAPTGGGIKIDADARGEGRGYSFEILHQPSFALAVVKLAAEQSILAEAGAMVSMSANVEL